MGSQGFGVKLSIMLVTILAFVSCGQTSRLSHEKRWNWLQENGLVCAKEESSEEYRRGYVHAADEFIEAVMSSRGRRFWSPLLNVSDDYQNGYHAAHLNRNRIENVFIAKKINVDLDDVVYHGNGTCSLINPGHGVKRISKPMCEEPALRVH